jgi:hypothetical protein
MQFQDLSQKPETSGKSRVDGGHIDPKPESSSRRALLKGSAAAVPVILTLRSGAATAITSTEQCLLRNNATATPIVSASANDVWVRQIREARELRKNSSTDASFWVLKNPSSSVWENEQHYIDGITALVTYSDGPGPNQMQGPPSTTTYDIIQPTSGTINRYILVLVDGNGNIVGYGNPSAGGNPIDGSCWSSVNANNDRTGLVI